MDEQEGIFKSFVKNGIGPFCLIGIILIFVGIVLIIQSYTGKFLPHDVEALEMTADRLYSFKNGRIVKFMFHDRISYGGSLISVGILYLWLTLFPLRKKEKWAWYVLLLSGIYGFGSFLTYLGYEYYDSWHGVGTILLIPVFIIGLIYSYQNKKINIKYYWNMKSKFGILNIRFHT